MTARYGAKRARQILAVTTLQFKPNNNKSLTINLCNLPN